MAVTVLDGTKAARIRAVIGSDPAANAEWSEAVPAGKMWELLGVSATMVQGATQTPWPSLIVDDGANVLFRAFSGTAAQNASVTTEHSWGRGVPAVGSGASLANTGPLAELILLPGFRVRSLTTGIGANSNWSAPRLLVAEYDL